VTGAKQKGAFAQHYPQLRHTAARTQTIESRAPFDHPPADATPSARRRVNLKIRCTVDKVALVARFLHSWSLARQRIAIDTSAL
jgi:hypothetical protein